MNDLSDRIRLLRTSQSLNQKQLAELVGITQPFLSDIEKGKRNPSIEVLQKLCDALGCSADYLLNRPSEGTKLEEATLPGGLTPDILRIVRERNISEEELKTALKVTAVMREGK
jgi:transcriptional regulator with XRE-family HTH domain